MLHSRASSRRSQACIYAGSDEAAQSAVLEELFPPCGCSVHLTNLIALLQAQHECPGIGMTSGRSTSSFQIALILSTLAGRPCRVRSLLSYPLGPCSQRFVRSHEPPC